MKTVLLIKTSSLGDIIHTLPALTDAVRAMGDIQFDWVVEENFAQIPAWHPAVRKVIPVAIRRWRKSLFKSLFSGEWQNFKKNIQLQQYDYIIDAQGLLKSALITRLGRGVSYGLDKNSARESLAAGFYQYPQKVDKAQHAVARVRQLFAGSLGYSLDSSVADYGISEYLQASLQADVNSELKHSSPASSGQILFLHGTTWQSKHWPEQYWIQLAGQLTAQGYSIVLPWGSTEEQQRAERIKKNSAAPEQVLVLDKMSLNELLVKILHVDAVIAVDTGLAHLAAALARPTIALYGPTSAGLTGTYGQNQLHLQAQIDCSPCFRKTCDKKSGSISPECYSRLTPERVTTALHELLNQTTNKQETK